MTKFFLHRKAKNVILLAEFCFLCCGFGDRTLKGLVNRGPPQILTIVGSGITEFLWSYVIPVEALWDLKAGLCPWKYLVRDPLSTGRW